MQVRERDALLEHAAVALAEMHEDRKYIKDLLAHVRHFGLWIHRSILAWGGHIKPWNAGLFGMPAVCNVVGQRTLIHTNPSPNTFSSKKLGLPQMHSLCGQTQRRKQVNAAVD